MPPKKRFDVVLESKQAGWSLSLFTIFGLMLSFYWFLGMVANGGLPFQQEFSLGFTVNLTMLAILLNRERNFRLGIGEVNYKHYLALQAVTAILLGVMWMHLFIITMENFNLLK